MLRFRVWDSKNETFAHQTDFFLCEQGKLFFKNCDGYIEETTTFLIPMESTGLKDINNKEIFEKDILKFIKDGQPKYCLVDDFHFFIRQYHTFLVYMSDQAIRKFGIIDARMQELSLPCEIVGNKFESPHLIKLITN